MLQFILLAEPPLSLVAPWFEEVVAHRGNLLQVVAGEKLIVFEEVLIVLAEWPIATPLLVIVVVVSATEEQAVEVRLCVHLNSNISYCVETTNNFLRYTQSNKVAFFLLHDILGSQQPAYLSQLLAIFMGMLEDCANLTQLVGVLPLYRTQRRPFSVALDALYLVNAALFVGPHGSSQSQVEVIGAVRSAS